MPATIKMNRPKIQPSPAAQDLQKIFRNNGLSLVMFGLALVFLIGQSITGLYTYNADQKEHGQAQVSYGQYLTNGHFIESVTENWESEFLQMCAFVFLTACLYQKGSAESKDPDEEDPTDAEPIPTKNPKMPWPVRQGGWVLQVYNHSLGLALLLLFLISFILHALGGAKGYSQEQIEHGQAGVTTLQYLATSRFWFESFQNWQSEFLSIGAMVVLSIFLRQKGSPESKPVATPHSEHGE